MLKGLMHDLNVGETFCFNYVIFSGLFGTSTYVLHFFHQYMTSSRVNMKCKYSIFSFCFELTVYNY